MSSRGRRDIQVTVSFLTTRVKKPDEDNWGKLKRVLKYLKGTRYLCLKLTVDNLNVIRWWVDASYNVHWDARGHTGGMMSLGQGAALNYSNKHKINVKSSTEGELVGAHDMLTSIMYMLYFIKAQDYSADQNIMYQDKRCV